jgi:superfamily II DNA or RNA helicase
MYDIPGRKLYDWQEDCLSVWFEEGGVGIINVATGAGKTTLALAAAHHLRALDPENALRVKIVVPKVFLARQWRDDLMELLDVPRNQIGMYYGAQKDAPDRPFMIYVINTARRHIARHIISDIKTGGSVFLICDECHHCGSTENAHIFDFLPHIDKGKYFALGLSATPQSENFETTLVPALGKEIYHYSLSDAGKHRVTAKFEIFHIAIDFTFDENNKYESYSIKIAALLSQLSKLYHGFGSTNTLIPLPELHVLARRTDRIGDVARRLIALYQKRKEIVHTAENKITCGVLLASLLLPESRTILFTERIATANEIYKQLSVRYPSRVSLYHSDMDPILKTRALDRYRSGESFALICCRALDEGLNVPETDAGIIVSMSSSPRQCIQRIGRIVRNNKKNAVKKIYNLYIKDTPESKTLPGEPAFENESRDGDGDESGRSNKGDFENVHVHKLAYDVSVSEGSLIHPGYDVPAMKALLYLADNGANARQLHRTLDHIGLGRIGIEHLLSETECTARIASAANEKERAYLTATQLVIRAKSGEI